MKRFSPRRDVEAQLTIELMAPKTCRSCGETKPLVEFPRNARRKDGRDDRCSVCNRARVRAWQEQNRERANERTRRWHAANKDYYRRYLHYAYWRDPDKARARAREQNAKNPEAARARRQRWADANRDKIKLKAAEYNVRERAKLREKLRTWKQANPQKVRIYNAAHRRSWSHPLNVPYIEVLLSDPCCYCGSRENLQIDHIVPVAGGGSNDWDNLTVACQPCNGSKNAAPLLAFLARA